MTVGFPRTRRVGSSLGLRSCLSQNEKLARKRKKALDWWDCDLVIARLRKKSWGCIPTIGSLVGSRTH